VAAAAAVAAWIIDRHGRRVRVAERRAKGAERMAEIGAMTGGLAHEIKNPLSTIGLNAQLLQESLEELELDETERDRLLRRLDNLRRETDRLRGILTDFLDFAGEIRLQTENADLNTIVEELADFFLPQAEQPGVTALGWPRHGGSSRSMAGVSRSTVSRALVPTSRSAFRSQCVTRRGPTVVFARR
jgi:signal transduction histidine kinase